jgi:hypothetical protein
MRFRDKSDKGTAPTFCANLGKSETETLLMIRQAIGEEIMSRAWVFDWHARFREDRKGRDRLRASQLHAPWQAKQSIPHITVTF